MDKLIEAIKAAGGAVEIVRVMERAPNTEAVLRVYIDGFTMTLYVVSSATHVAASFGQPIAREAIAALMPRQIWGSQQ